MFNPTYILSFPFHQEITEGNDIPDSSFADVPTSEGEAESVNEQAVPEHEISRSNSPNAIFTTIKGAGSAMVEKLSSVNRLNERLGSILGDWDHENEDDVGYMPRRRRGY